MGLLEFIGSVAIVISALAGATTYIVQTIISRLVSRDLETYKTELAKTVEHEKAMLTRELDQFRKELDAAHAQRQLQFTHLHAKRAEVFPALYSRLVKAHREMRIMVSPMQFSGADKQAQRVAAAKAVDDYREFSEQQRLYLDDELSTIGEQAENLMRVSFVEFDMAQGHGNATSGAIDTKIWVQASTRMEKELPPVIETMRLEMRRVLEGK